LVCRSVSISKSTDPDAASNPLANCPISGKAPASASATAVGLAIPRNSLSELQNTELPNRGERAQQARQQEKPRRPPQPTFIDHENRVAREAPDRVISCLIPPGLKSFTLSPRAKASNLRKHSGGFAEHAIGR
jgi:hypothetical protein